MPSPIALTSPPRQESIFKKRSPSFLTAMRSAQSYLIALSEADARARGYDSASTTSAPSFSSSSWATTSSEGTLLHDSPCDNSDGLAYPITPPTSERPVSANHLQFGFCPNENYRYKSAHKPGSRFKQPHEQDPPYYILITTYLSYLLLICLGHLRDFFGKRLYPAFYRHLLSFDVSHSPLACHFSFSSAWCLRLSCTSCILNAYTRLPDRAMQLLIRISTPFTHDGSRRV